MSVERRMRRRVVLGRIFIRRALDGVVQVLGIICGVVIWTQRARSTSCRLELAFVKILLMILELWVPAGGRLKDDARPFFEWVVEDDGLELEG
jgi:hypothetical protein